MSSVAWFLLGSCVGALPTIVGWIETYKEIYENRKRLEELKHWQDGWDACVKYTKGGE